MSVASPGEPWRALAACRAGDDRQDRHGLVDVLSRGSRAAANRSRSKATSARRPASIGSGGASASSPRRSRTIFASRPTPICVDDPSSPAYNTIASRARIGPSGPCREHEQGAADVSSRAAGRLSDRREKASAGSCIFIHVWRSPDHRHRRLRRGAGAARRGAAGFRRTALCWRSCRAARWIGCRAVCRKLIPMTSSASACPGRCRARTPGSRCRSLRRLPSPCRRSRS